MLRGRDAATPPPPFRCAHYALQLTRAMLLDAQNKEQCAPASPRRGRCGEMSDEDAEDRARRAGHKRKRELECQDLGPKEALPAGCKHCDRCRRVIRGPGEARHRPSRMAYKLSVHHSQSL